MTSFLILILLFGLVILNLGIGLALDRANLKYSSKPFPEELMTLFTEEEAKKSRAYLKEKTNFSNLIALISSVVFLFLLGTGFFGYWNGILRTNGLEGIWESIVFLISLFLISDIIQTPVQWYSTFVIEEKYGFNTSTQKIFVMDKLKGYLLAGLIGLPILYLLFFLIDFLNEDFWIPFLLVMTGFMLFMQFFYTTLILPIFNKLNPVENQELIEGIKELSKKVKFPIKQVLMIDGSKRSKKANAFFSGFGKQKKIVLYDTLLDQLNIREICGVFAHEIGHYKKKHIYQGMVFSILQTGLMLYIFSLLLFSSELSQALGSQEWAPQLNLIAIGILISPVSNILGFFGNWVSRRNEFQADGFAKEYGYAQDLVSALKKLSVKNLSNPNPHPYYVAWNYSHPTLTQRIKAIRSKA